VAHAAGMDHVFGPAIEIRGGRYGNALLARGDIGDVEVVPLPDAEPRCGIVARVALPDGRALSVVATHLGLKGAAAQQLPVLLEVLRDRPAPRVLLGDLNLDPEPVDRLAAAAGFTRLAAGPTWPAHRPRREIDHVLVDGLVAGRPVVHHLPVSDHRAVSVAVEPG
jgi:endonuclease/exonuclease/phosphatase family metal-dependent hydrolase